MAEQTQMAAQPARALVSAVVARGDRLALIVRGPIQWRAMPGVTFVPVELPGGALDPAADLSETMSRLTQALLSQPARVLASARLYGPSAAHAIDRLDAGLEASPLPLLRLERGIASDDADAAEGAYVVQRVTVRAYRVALEGEPQPGAGIAGIVWVPPRVLRSAMPGLPMSDTVSRHTVVVWCSAPPDALDATALRPRYPAAWKRQRQDVEASSPAGVVSTERSAMGEERAAMLYPLPRQRRCREVAHACSRSQRCLTNAIHLLRHSA